MSLLMNVVPVQSSCAPTPLGQLYKNQVCSLALEYSLYPPHPTPEPHVHSRWNLREEYSPTSCGSFTVLSFMLAAYDTSGAFNRRSGGIQSVGLNLKAWKWFGSWLPKGPPLPLCRAATEALREGFGWSCLIANGWAWLAGHSL